jgi:hypothetical protein
LSVIANTTCSAQTIAQAISFSGADQARDTVGTQDLAGDAEMSGHVFSQMEVRTGSKVERAALRLLLLKKVQLFVIVRQMCNIE